MPELALHLSVLPVAQQRLWRELSILPPAFVLYGGTALALHLGHRHSVDFDFFADRALDLQSLEAGLPFLAGARIVQRELNTLSAIVDRGGPVKVSFFGVPKLPRLEQPVTVRENGVRVAALLDLAGTKASVLQVRAEAKDYLDMDALITKGGVGLPRALAAAQALYGPAFNPEITLKALSYFGDGDLPTLPDDIKHRLAAVARAVDLERLPVLSCSMARCHPDTDLGL